MLGGGHYSFVVKGGGHYSFVVKQNPSTLETVLVRVGRAINVVDPNNLQLR